MKQRVKTISETRNDLLQPDTYYEVIHTFVSDEAISGLFYVVKLFIPQEQKEVYMAFDSGFFENNSTDLVPKDIVLTIDGEEQQVIKFEYSATHKGYIIDYHKK